MQALTNSQPTRMLETCKAMPHGERIRINSTLGSVVVRRHDGTDECEERIDSGCLANHDRGMSDADVIPLDRSFVSVPPVVPQLAPAGWQLGKPPPDPTMPVPPDPAASPVLNRQNVAWQGSEEDYRQNFCGTENTRRLALRSTIRTPKQ